MTRRSSLRRRPFLRGKIPSLMRRARTVIVGNDYLSQYASRYSEHVSVIPTVVDLDRYSPRQNYECRDERGLVIGWVGTPVTARYLSTLAGVFRQAARDHAVVVRCVGTPAGFSIPGVLVETVPWSEATESEIVRTFDIGVMRLRRNRCRGQMRPEVDSVHGLRSARRWRKARGNTEIIRQGVDGFLASRDEEYLAVIERLAGEPALRARIGRAGGEEWRSATRSRPEPRSSAVSSRGQPMGECRPAEPPASASSASPPRLWRCGRFSGT